MDLRDFISKTVTDYLNENISLENKNDIWYHGTPDVRQLEKEGGFSNRNISVSYINDLDSYTKLQKLINTSRESEDETEYFMLLDKSKSLKTTYTFKKPIFLTNNYNVAKTYADPRRAFDYQNSKEKVISVKVNTGKVATIIATNDRFRFIDTDKVKQGFLNSGVLRDDIEEAISMFNWSVRDKKNIKTDDLAAIGDWFGFDCIDVVGVLDSYHDGNIKSTVRMVYDPHNIKIIKNDTD